MFNPCFTAMLEGAVMALNPPTGLTAVPQDGSNASTQINALFAALPHANTNTRNVYFFRPSTRYKVNARLDITVDGTAVLCGGNSKSTLKNAMSFSRDTEDPWFRGSALSPHVRMDNVEHVLWHGGGLKGRDVQSGGSATQTFIEMGTARFCVADNLYVIFCENTVQCNGFDADDFCEFCVVRDTHFWQSDGVRPTAFFGADNIRSTSGKVRLCGGHNHWGAGATNGPTFTQALDCFYVGGYSENNSNNGSVHNSGCLRFIWILANQEATLGNLVNSGASFTSIGHNAWGTGDGDIYKFGP